MRIIYSNNEFKATLTASASIVRDFNPDIYHKLSFMSIEEFVTEYPDQGVSYDGTYVIFEYDEEKSIKILNLIERFASPIANIFIGIVGMLKTLKHFCKDFEKEVNLICKVDEKPKAEEAPAQSTGDLDDVK